MEMSNVRIRIRIREFDIRHFLFPVFCSFCNSRSWRFSGRGAPLIDIRYGLPIFHDETGQAVVRDLRERPLGRTADGGFRPHRRGGAPQPGSHAFRHGSRTRRRRG